MLYVRAKVRAGVACARGAAERPPGDAAREARRRLALCAAGGSDCAAGARALSGTLALPETPEGLWDASFPALDPEPRSPQPSAEDELTRALGAAQVGRLTEAR